eukprot:GHVU01023854.1.p1 GENE.GHVU01023854.1~~GHVU01023854.1.p1  ORF type:complete len:459 (+),score=30.35 GHVU01023854.1:323-1699(+)
MRKSIIIFVFALCMRVSSSTTADDDLLEILQAESEAHTALISVLTTSLANTVSRKRRGSVPDRSANIDRHRPIGEALLFADYFSSTPTWGADIFKRRFRITRERFEKILTAFNMHGYLQQGRDCSGLLGASTRLKMTAALRVLAYGAVFDSMEEYLRISNSLICDCLKLFCAAMVAVFAEEYLRLPTAEEAKKILAFNATRGFRGMLGSIDCMHWKWDNCPRGWRGQYKGKEDKPSLILEAVATQDLRIWHSFFGMPGSNNDLNVIDRSPLISVLTSSNSIFSHRYTLNGVEFDRCYLLGDGIYKRLGFVAKPVSNPTTVKESTYTDAHAAGRKDVERAFGVVQGQWHIVRTPARYYDVETLQLIMTTCLILHNMNVEDRNNTVYEPVNAGRDGRKRMKLDWQSHTVGSTEVDEPTPFVTRIMGLTTAFSSQHQQRLESALIEHIWDAQGAEAVSTQR